MLLPVINNWLLCFSCNTSNVQQVAEMLRAENIETVQERPYLAGMLAREDKFLMAERLELTYPDDGRIELGFSVNDLTSKPELWRTSYGKL